jgi:hypothetical protein
VAAANKPTGHPCVNVSNGKTSFLLLKGHGLDFPIARFVDVRDINNDFAFNAFMISQPPDPRRLALRLVSALPPGGGGPTDGLLSITLLIPTGNPGVFNSLLIADVPVDYIDDPTGP